MQYVVCYSGGVSSALAAVETVRRYGRDHVILLNHDISPLVEDVDIKRFKNEVAAYLGMKIEYANMEGWEELTPLRVCKELGAFTYSDRGRTLCTYKLKTEPFHKWLKENYPVKKGEISKEITVVYGFDKTPHEVKRIQRRTGIMLTMGYRTDYPLVLWERTITDIEEIGIKRPISYEKFRHANCKGCLKAGKQHWYTVYCLYPDIFFEAIQTEEEIGYSIMSDTYLIELLPRFKEMVKKGIDPNDVEESQRFWAKERKTFLGQYSIFDDLPCECSI